MTGLEFLVGVHVVTFGGAGDKFLHIFADFGEGIISGTVLLLDSVVVCARVERHVHVERQFASLL
ncbi:hypothetical protein [Bifidobacterium bohemicum]|uniref:hypothetical protein n=1 Tax=Bifidobacterium bohemicum TaxID=638617 RepID=UPI000529CF8F|nr:hypothetical protein [Bifidobacterium bohemicum]